ncbi:MAG TPA: maleylacetoacetate isomerase [Kofleriaceae bacterium]|nr:maleylacetoacetate isomerase [Kofleriaceae bacterium]
MKLVLHNYWRSSASHRVRIALHYKQLPFEYVVINIVKREQFADAYREKNPMSQVPTLQITEEDGTVHTLTQSLPIMEFLEERFPAIPLFSKDPYKRAAARGLAELINSGIQPLQNLTVTNAIKTLGADVTVWTKGFIETGLAAFAAAAAETAGTFCVGDEVSIADCCLVPQLASARRFGADVARHERLLRIEERCLALPGFKNAAPDQQPDAVK